MEARDPKNRYYPIIMSDLERKYPYIPWLTYINNMFSPHKALRPNDTIILAGTKYFDKLNQVLQKTPKRVLANFIYWRVLLESIATLSKLVKTAYKKFSSEVTGMDVELPRWMTCLTYANSKMSLAVGSLYVRRYFDQTKKLRMVKIVQDLHRTFERMLKEVDWMDETTKAAALDKLRHMTPLIAYPDELLDDDKLSEHYKGFDVDPDSLIKTELNYNRYALKKAVELLNEPVKRFDWTNFGTAAEVNAFYSPSTNSIST